ncbi:TPA_asm: hypothetical protein, partial [ssRNA phage SRR6960799_7]
MVRKALGGLMTIRCFDFNLFLNQKEQTTTRKQHKAGASPPF